MLAGLLVRIVGEIRKLARTIEDIHLDQLVLLLFDEGFILTHLDWLYA